MRQRRVSRSRVKVLARVFVLLMELITETGERKEDAEDTCAYKPSVLREGLIFNWKRR